MCEFPKDLRHFTYTLPQKKRRLNPRSLITSNSNFFIAPPKIWSDKARINEHMLRVELEPESSYEAAMSKFFMILCWGMLGHRKLWQKICPVEFAGHDDIEKGSFVTLRKKEEPKRLLRGTVLVRRTDPFVALFWLLFFLSGAVFQPFSLGKTAPLCKEAPFSCLWAPFMPFFWKKWTLLAKRSHFPKRLLWGTSLAPLFFLSEDLDLMRSWCVLTCVYLQNGLHEHPK